jgi:hypothetical protein
MKNCISCKDEQHRILYFVSVRGLTAILLVSGLGVDDQQNGFLEVPISCVAWVKAEV